jgi:hypothetical protein
MFALNVFATSELFGAMRQFSPYCLMGIATKAFVFVFSFVGDFGFFSLGAFHLSMGQSH